MDKIEKETEELRTEIKQLVSERAKLATLIRFRYEKKNLVENIVKLDRDLKGHDGNTDDYCEVRAWSRGH